MFVYPRPCFVEVLETIGFWKVCTIVPLLDPLGTTPARHAQLPSILAQLYGRNGHQIQVSKSLADAHMVYVETGRAPNLRTALYSRSRLGDCRVSPQFIQ